MLQVRRTKPIELLQGSKRNEQEPRAKGFLALLGIICLAVGYTISVTIKSPISALALFCRCDSCDHRHVSVVYFWQY